MRKGLLFMKRNTFFRALCVALCAALFLGTFAILFSSVAAAEEEEVVVVLAENEDADEPDAEAGLDDAAPPAATPVSEVSKAEEAPNFLVGALDWIFRTFGFIGFTLDPYQFTIINQTPTFQWLLGFNDFYDTMPWVMNVWTDHFTCQFKYAEKDWRLQFWKGGYGLCLATGGEIGVYNKTWGADHYVCPVSIDDWMHMEYSIYNRGKHLFTRPSPRLSGDMGPYWWATGYRILSICTDFLNGPRRNVIMDATLLMHDAEMLAQFLPVLESMGFERTEGDLNLNTPEKYSVNPQVATPAYATPAWAASQNRDIDKGVWVRFIWQNFTKGIY